MSYTNIFLATYGFAAAVVGTFLWNRIKNFTNNFKNPAYFYISTKNNEYEEYIEILEDNVKNILCRLKEIIVLEDNCNFEVLKCDILILINGIRNKMRKINNETILFHHISYNMMNDLNDIVEYILSHINSHFRLKKSSLRVGCNPVNNSYYNFKFYNLSLIPESTNSKEKMNIYQFTDYDQNEGDNFALIEYNSYFHDWLEYDWLKYNSYFHDWLEYYYPHYNGTNLCNGTQETNSLSIYETNLCDGTQKRYTKIKINTKQNMDNLKNQIKNYRMVILFIGLCCK